MHDDFDLALEKLKEQMDRDAIRMSDLMRDIEATEKRVRETEMRAKCVLGQHEINWEFDMPACWCGEVEIYYA